MNTGETLECYGVWMSPRAIAEAGAVKIRVEDITRVALKHGLLAERPLVSVLVGVAALAFGLTAIGFALWVLVVAHTFHYSIAACGAASVFGLYFLASGLKRGYYLEVRTHNDRRKLCFHGAAEPADLVAFARTVGERLGQPVDIEIESLMQS